jgi:hypothetical protein
VLNLHSVWFVLGAVELELPVCARSWWNMGHMSAIDGVLENSETRFKLVVPKKINIKNNTTKAKQAIAFLLIFLYPPFGMLGPTVFTAKARPIVADQDGHLMIVLSIVNRLKIR